MEIYIVVDTRTEQVTVIPTSARVESAFTENGERRKGVKPIHWELFRGPVEEGLKDDALMLSITRVKEKGEFLLVFDDAEAFGRSEIRSADQRPALPRKPGLYHYKVVACVDRKVYADVYCPSIIIR